ncbi:MAG: phospholipase D family protein [Alphaproteobacteria bacterium]|nr:phospholipase D family protein [Alphaproteobacteria bacterium]
MILEKFSWLLFAIPFVGCPTIPTSMHDKRMSGYKPKITNKDFDYNPLETPVASEYIQELTRGKDPSGATLIDDGLSAFVVRAAFARMATKTIDLQTYIYSNDFSSHVLIGELKNAADRGVKVRILIDDYGTNSDIADIILLNQHPNVEVKIFNAVKRRSRFFYYPQMLMDFNRLNSRMHNKLFIVDNVALITGGRNVGSNYFMPETASNFSDTDILCMGAIARDATKSFNAYWNHHLAVPASVIPKACSKHALKKLDRQFQKLAQASAINTRKFNTIISLAIREYRRKNFGFSWGHGRFIADPPEKVDMPRQRKEKYRGEIIITLNRLWQETKKTAYVSAAYFVPGTGGMKMVCNEEKSGVHVTIVTNSLASTNAPTVYGKWEKYRTKLIKSGVDVYEFMLAAENRRGKIRNRERKQAHFSVMHSKTIVFDNKISWIGSFNLDPRSTYYNTENVVVFESAEFARKLRNMIIDDTRISWHVTNKNNTTMWTGFRPGDTKPRVYYHNPDTTIFRRIFKILTKIIPEKFV